MNEPVLDASVIIAIAKNERYDTGLLQLIDGGVMSAVNFAEVITRLLDLGLDPASSPIQRTLSLLSVVEPFTETQARIAGELRRLGKHVALGDRACMALAIELNADLYTADKEWTTSSECIASDNSCSEQVALIRCLSPQGLPCTAANSSKPP